MFDCVSGLSGGDCYGSAWEIRCVSVYFSVDGVRFVLDDVCELFVEVCCFLFVGDGYFVVKVD